MVSNEEEDDDYISMLSGTASTGPPAPTELSAPTEPSIPTGPRNTSGPTSLEEDDYMSMSFVSKSAEPSRPTKPESSVKRASRLRRERLERARVASKSELRAKREEAREKALNTRIDASNKGAAMMAKMGYKGGPLGQTEDAVMEPIKVEIKTDKRGIGAESDKKRKIRETAEAVAKSGKRAKTSAEEFRQRNSTMRQNQVIEGQMWSAMRICEAMETTDASAELDNSHTPMPSDNGTEEIDGQEKIDLKRTPLRSIPLVWRPLIKRKMQEDVGERLHDLRQRRLDRADDSPDHKEKVTLVVDVSKELNAADPELNTFEALSFGTRLVKVLSHLRAKHHYCFWCKRQYPDKSMDGCPGLTEDEHDEDDEGYFMDDDFYGNSSL